MQPVCLYIRQISTSIKSGIVNSAVIAVWKSGGHERLSLVESASNASRIDDREKNAKSSNSSKTTTRELAGNHWCSHEPQLGEWLEQWLK